jgi:KUP system potassium uptake protein
MGHFGRKPIRVAWFGMVLPCLVLNYYGQAALMLRDPSAIRNPFYLMFPDWAQIPMLLLATAATVIASQAVISGAFSMTRQAMQLGYCPRLAVSHTSADAIGQIYIPWINWMLLGAVIALVLGFRSSTALASAYGIAVTGTMAIDTVLAAMVFRRIWGWGYLRTYLFLAVFLSIDLAFFGANTLKIFEGGWFPLAIGGLILLLMLTWRDGRELLSNKLRDDAIDLRSFLDSVFTAPPTRVSGTAVFLTADPGAVPNALLHNLKHNKVLHAQNLFVTVRNHEVPWIGLDKRIESESLGHDCWQVTIHYGFKNDPDVPLALSLMHGRGCDLEPMNTSYFLSRDSIVPTVHGAMAQWREKLFAQMHLNASAAADFLKLPSNSVVELGSKIEI